MTPWTKRNFGRLMYADSIDVNLIIDEVISGAVTHAAVTEDFVQKFSFYGKSLQEWSEELTISIPPANQLTPKVMRELSRERANKYQIASHFYSVSSSINSAIVGGGEIKKSDLVKAIVRSYESKKMRKPAAAVVERMADSYMKSTTSSRVASKIVTNFWKQQLDALSEVRKAIENITMLMSIELKYLGD